MLGVVCLSRPQVPACPRVPRPRVLRHRVPRHRVPLPRVRRPRVPRPRVPRPRVLRPRVPSPTSSSSEPHVLKFRAPRPQIPSPTSQSHFQSHVPVPRPPPTFSRDKFLLGPSKESLLKTRETLNFEFVCWTDQVMKYLSWVWNKHISFLHFLSVCYTWGTTWILTTAKSCFTSPLIMLSWDRLELILK